MEFKCHFFAGLVSLVLLGVGLAGCQKGGSGGGPMEA